MDYHSRLIEVLEDNKNIINSGVANLSKCIRNTLGSSNVVWLAGNGGSASAIEHFETDLTFIKQQDTNLISNVFALTANSALFSAAANDFAYSEVFSTILKKRARVGDLLITVSASGNSQNIINAISQANEIGLTTFSLIGFDGGKNLGLSTYEIYIKSRLGEYEIVEDIHLSIFHATKLNILLEKI